MSQNRPEVLSRSVQETDLWLKELAEDMRLENQSQAYGALRAVLHALRDRLTVDMAAHLASQFPLVVTGIFFDGWKPAQSPTSSIQTRADFIEAVRERAHGHGEFDPNHAAISVLRLLEKKVSPGQIEKVVDQLPADLKDYWRQLGTSRAA